ncbi:MAG TPA: Kiwa anti-phage protein KwaB-like domain-containing protein [Terriglobia bacterium]|nr:Kiwa anti-phage protein KwaB-like domain-containing protein [Terriglobia bacterium]
MAVLDDLKAFDVDAAFVSLWIFKSSSGAKGGHPTFRGHWVETTDAVDVALKETVKAERNRLEELIEYDLLAENNESSALRIGRDETHAGLLVDAVAAETENRRVQNVKHLLNSTFYLIKLTHNGEVLYAVRRTPPGWKTKRAISVRTLVLAESRLDIDDSPRFDIEKNIDFFICGEEVLILHKGHFESTLQYKQAHSEDFLALQKEPEFADLFVDLTPLVQHVGSNKIQLRRMCSVHQKAHYRDTDFMARVRDHHTEYGLTLQFNNEGRIIVTPDTGAQVITALLDHRLASGFSKRVYDVPSATPVNVT